MTGKETNNEKINILSAFERNTNYQQNLNIIFLVSSTGAKCTNSTMHGINENEQGQIAGVQRPMPTKNGPLKGTHEKVISPSTSTNGKSFADENLYQ